MAFNREQIDSTASDFDVNEINQNNFSNNTIFVPIEKSFTLTFDDPIDSETLSLHTNNTDIDVSERGKRGSVQLSCVGDPGLGSDADSLNLRLKKGTSSPPFIVSSSPGTLIKDQDATIEVEMLSQPVISNANATFSFEPVVNLASNSTYIFNVTKDVQDKDGSETSFIVGTGFVTDNTRSVILSSKPFSGQVINLPSDNELKFEKDEVIKKSGRNLPVATVIEHDEVSILTYDLNPVCYFINVAFTAASPCVITTSSAHGLFADNKITVYDIVSGSGLSKRTYSISSVGTNTITLNNVNNLHGTAGRLNFYVDFSADDEIVSTGRTKILPPRESVWAGTDIPITLPAPFPMPTVPGLQTPSFPIESFQATEVSDDIQIKATSNPRKNFVDIELNEEIQQFLPTTATKNYAKSIRYDDTNNQLSYVPVTGSESNIIKSTDNFANNIILKQGTITMLVSANTNPVHNTHPFNTSAPTVTEFVPDVNDAITRHLEVIEITRSGTTATIFTNSIHALNIGDPIKIEGCNETDYNISATVQTIVDPFRFTYEVENEPRSPATPFSGKIDLKTGETPALQATAFQVRFSQSMNTSTISVANASHFIYANGTSSTTGYDKTAATIQLSDDNFATSTGLVNCKSISANTGNSLFTIVPETLLRGKSFKIKVTTNVRDLGDTNTDVDYITTNTFSTGTKSFNPSTGKELVFVDNIPPKIRKITLGSNVLESSNVEEISAPPTGIAVNFSDNFVVQFNESMNVETVNVNSTNTDPFGTIQVSDDDFTTVIQMDAQPAVSTTSERNDTFTFHPEGNVSSNATYVVKVTKGVADESPNQNFLENDNVSSTKTLTIGSATGSYTAGETVIGTRTASTRANSGAVTLNETLLGTTSLAKGILRAHTPGSGTLTSIEYTEIASEDGTVKEFLPGEVLTGLTSGKTITTSNATITQAASGVVLNFSDPSLRIRHSNTSIAFDTTDGILTGVTSGVKGTMTAITNTGFSTTTTGLVVTALMRKQSDDSIVDIGAGAVTGIDIDSNVIIKFSQTMNADTIVVNSTDSRVRSTDTIIFSADSNFGNCIPLMPNPTITENGTRFEFKPVILSNTSLNLTQGDRYDVKITRGAKTKGGSNTASDVTESYAAIYSSTYSVVNASVFDNNGEEIILGQYADTTVISANVSKSTPIIIHFSEVIDASTFASGAGNEVQLATASNFGSGQIACTIQRSGRFGTQLTVIPNATLTAAPHYLRIIAGGTNEGSQALSATWQAGYFTTA